MASSLERSTWRAGGRKHRMWVSNSELGGPRLLPSARSPLPSAHSPLPSAHSPAQRPLPLRVVWLHLGECVCEYFICGESRMMT